jgi:hypothetical protein
MIICILFPGSVSARPTIQNPSFEADTGWTYFDNGDYWAGEYTDAWASQGNRSFLIHIPITDCEYSPPAYSYGEVVQDVDLTGISTILFDLRVHGLFYVPVFGEDHYYSTEVWIGDTKVYSVEKQSDAFIDLTYYDQAITTTGYSGVHRLTFRMQSHASDCTLTYRQMFFDNIRFETNPYFLPMIIK